VAAGLGTRRDDEIYTSLLQRNRLVAGSRRAHRDDAAAPAFLEQRPRRNAEDETENRWTSIEQGGGLIVERRPAAEWKPGRLEVQLLKEFGHGFDGGCIGAGRRCESRRIFRQYPEIHRKGSSGKIPDLCDNLDNPIRRHALRAE
jgi:hypothetical protein